MESSPHPTVASSHIEKLGGPGDEATLKKYCFSLQETDPKLPHTVKREDGKC